jgi:small subunit ribosomal protein S16
MVKIRLKRGGAKKRPHYRVIAIDERARRDGRALEYLGTYSPVTKPAQIDLRTDRIQAWVDQGAQLSGAVRALLKRARKQAAAAGAQA